MSKVIVLDSGPLGLLVHRSGVAPADDCRRWAKAHLLAGSRFIVPEIADYELRRELLRLGKKEAVAKLDAFAPRHTEAYLPITTDAMRLAAELWAQSRRTGTPTASPSAIDVDVILAAQVLSCGHASGECVVATSNLGHLTQFVPAQRWDLIAP